MEKEIVKKLKLYKKAYEGETGKVARLSEYHKGRYNLILDLLNEE